MVENQLTDSLDSLIKKYGYKRVEKHLLDYMDKPKLKIDETGMAVMNALYLVDFMTMAQLMKVVFPKMTHSGCLYHLNKLMSDGLVINESFNMSGKTRTAVWQITAFGVRTFINLSKGELRESLPPVKSIDEKELNHDTRVVEIFVELADSLGGFKEMMRLIDIYPFEMRSLKLGTEDKFDSKRIKEYVINESINPDAIFETVRGNIKVYVEYETGTKSKKDVTRNLERYAEYLSKTREHIKRPVILLYIMEDETNRDWIEKKAVEIGGRSGLANFRAYLRDDKLVKRMGLIASGGPDGTAKQPNT